MYIQIIIALLKIFVLIIYNEEINVTVFKIFEFREIKFYKKICLTNNKINNEQILYTFIQHEIVF